MSALLEGAELRGVLAVPGSHEGREALRVRLTPAAAAGVPGVDYVDQPTFVLLPIALTPRSNSIGSRMKVGWST